MEANLIDNLAKEITEKLKSNIFIEVEASGRHVHLNRESIDLLFGKGYNLTKIKDLSQPGQFVCKERLTIIGRKGSINNVVILGPEREKVQVEVSNTDAVALGVKVPLRESGNLEDTPGIILVSDNFAIKVESGVIVAKRHIHMTLKDAKKFNVKNNQIVKVKLLTDRSLIFDDVVIRVSNKFNTFMHIDYDEANACGFNNGSLAMILK